MFEHKSEIRPYLAEAELAAFADDIEQLCVPAVAFDRAAAREAACGQLGGEPLLPPSLAWPERPPYRDGELLSGRFGRRSPGLPRSFESTTPLHFVGEIDLAALKRAGMLDARWPQDGRLLFFWDPLCGPWIDSAESCRVLHDRSAAAMLARRAPPSELEFFKEHDLMPVRFAEVPLKPLAIWSMPDRFLMQDTGSLALRQAFLDDDLEYVWDDFFETIMDMRAAQLASGRAVLPHRFGGWPIPEQNDPRFEAAMAGGGVADHWTMVLQVAISEICTSFGEGVVYFVMREDDLRVGNFDRVHAVYQQT